MAAWSQSPFLQALGWTMLNSIWQMALLFLAFSLCQHLVRLSSHNRYYLAIGSMGAGIIWFTYTFFVFYADGASGTIAAQHQLAPTSQTWNVILSSASLAYLLLLLIPSYRLFKNWRYIEHLKKYGLQKTAVEYGIFVKKVAQRLGIRHTVQVYLSHLVQSPVTIGYIKPIILLPIAAINNLNPQQVEAVLLHELSHIKRYDYLVNFIITLFQTLFYFNPFVKKFVSVIEFEREKCCDELVLQFQYDKISYASALLLLEKNLRASETLVLAAAGKKHLLSRIEKIVGQERKTGFTFHQFAGLLVSFLVVIFINSLFFVNSDITLRSNHTFASFENPLTQFDASPVVAEGFSKVQSSAKEPVSEKQPAKVTRSFKIATFSKVVPLMQQPDPDLFRVSYDASDELITPEAKERIVQTLEKTKKVLAKTKWKEVETSIGDGMTAGEKKTAKHEYLEELEKIDWKILENRLKSEYENLDWAEVEAKLNSSLTDLKLDSLQTSYHLILSQLQKTEAKTRAGYKIVLPVPDVSVHELNILKSEIATKLDSIKVIRERKIINF